MSIHRIPAAVDLDRAATLLEAAGRLPSGLVHGNGPEAPPTAIEFTPDLTPAEELVLAQIVAAAARPADYGTELEAVLAAEGAGLRALVSLPAPSAADITLLTQFYQAANGSPTNTQRDAALKAFLRVAGSLARVVRAAIKEET